MYYWMLLTLRSSSRAAFKWFSIASRSMTGIAVSMLYTSKLPVIHFGIRQNNLVKWIFYLIKENLFK